MGMVLSEMSQPLLNSYLLTAMIMISFLAVLYLKPANRLFLIFHNLLTFMYRCFFAADLITEGVTSLFC